MIELLAAPVTVPGLYQLSEEEYHADPCPLPSLSRSIGQMMIYQSPRHAWTAHPRLNPNIKVDESRNERRTDIGSGAHAKLLKQPIGIVHIDADDYKKKDSQAKRKEAYANGMIPLLKPDFQIVQDMIARAEDELAHNELAVIRALVDDSLSVGVAYNEVTVCWLDKLGGHWCRARIDRLVIEERRLTIIDYKTTEMSAAPDDVAKAIFNNAYDLQDGFYRRGIRHLLPQIDRHELTLDFLFMVQEQNPPHEITVARIDAAGRMIGEKKASAAVALWDRHIKSGEWPGYPTEIKSADMPAWTETRWIAREIEDSRLQNMPFDPLTPLEASPYQPKKIMEAC